jgi:uncharacterized protein YraI
MKRNSLIAIAVILCLAFAATVPAFAQTPQPSSTPEPTAVQPPLTASSSLFITSNFLVNVRSGPGTEYTILGKLRADDAVDITGKLADGSWLRINFNGQEGWVLASLFDVNGDLTTAQEAVAGASAVLRSGASTTTSSSGSTTDQSGDVVGTTTGNVNLRSTPSTQGDVIVIIPFSTELTATGRTANNNWVQVTYNNQTGWITSAVYSVSRGNVVNLPSFDASGVAIPATAVPTARPTTEAQPTAQATATTSP